MSPEQIAQVDAAMKRLDANDIAGAKKILTKLVVLAEQAGAGNEPPVDGAPVDDGSDPAPVDEQRLRRARVDPKLIQTFRARMAKGDRHAAQAEARGFLAGTASRRARLGTRA